VPHVSSVEFENGGRQGNGVRNSRLWSGLLGIESAVLERIEYDEDEGLLVAHVRPSSLGAS